MNRESWIDSFLLPLAVILLITFWLTLWLRWLLRFAVIFTEQAPPAISPLLIMGTLVLMAVTARLAVNSLLPLERARNIVLIMAFAAIGLAAWLTFPPGFPLEFLRGLFKWGNFVSPQFILLLAAGYAAWRGVFIGQSRIPYDDLAQTFYRGILALALLFAVNRGQPLLAPDEALTAELSFFGIGLGALALASFQRARRQQQEMAGTSFSFNRYWVGTALGTIGAVLISGLVMAGLVSPETLGRLRPFMRLFDPLANLLIKGLGFVLIVITTPVFIFIEWLMRAGLDMIRLPQLPESLKFSDAAIELVDQILNSPVVKVGSRGVSMFIILGVIAALIWIAVRRMIKLPAQELDEMRESIISSELLLNQLKQLFARQGRKAAPLPPYLALTGLTDDPRRLIRRAYQDMLEWAASRGLQRPAGHTPRRYAEMLTQAEPTAQDALATLTRAYVQARYADEPPSVDEAREAEKALEQIGVSRKP